MNLQDYSKPEPIAGVQIIDLKVHKDDGGSFCEIARISALRDTIAKHSHGILLNQFSGLEDEQIQVNFSILHPGTIKAFHLHKNQTDIFFAPRKLLINLIDFRNYINFRNYIDVPHSIKELNELVYIKTAPKMRIILENQLLIVGPGIAHGISNPYNDDRCLIYFVNQFFNPKDEWRLPWNLAGEEIWKIQKG